MRSLVWSGEEVGIQIGKACKNHAENPNEKMVRKLDAQAENVRKYLVLQRNIIPAQKHAAEEGATSDPRDEIAPQKI